MGFVMALPGPLELGLILLVLLLVFGAKRIPEIARGLGKGIREFKDATSEISRELDVESQRRGIDPPRAPQHGAPQPRGPQEQAPPRPAQAAHPGDAQAAQQQPQEQQS
jgi:sec-independent protein translocase protein TatA